MLMAVLLLATVMGCQRASHAALVLFLHLHVLLFVHVAARNKGEHCCCVHIEKQILLLPGNPPSVPLKVHLPNPN